MTDGSRVAVVGGGPAGSFFTYFLLDFAQRAHLQVIADIYEPRDFTSAGPAGCNMCGGIISESLVQMLAIEGIRLPATVVERGIDSYVLHTEEGRVRIATPRPEKRIAAVHRGGGPRGAAIGWAWQSFDNFLLNLARERGANLVRERVESVEFRSGRPHLLKRSMRAAMSGNVGAVTSSGVWVAYDLVALAVGIKSVAPPQLLDGLGYRRPKTTTAFNCEFFLGQEVVSRLLGNSMHVFLLRMPWLKFGALIPKGNHITMTLLGRDIDRKLVEEFIRSDEVRRCLPPDIGDPPLLACRCAPQLSLGAGSPLFADRVLMVGDCGVTRLYKDGIGAAYRTAKAAALAVVFEGISAQALRNRYWPACRAIERDNAIGRALFLCSEQQKRAFAQRGLLRMVQREQRQPPGQRLMSSVLWDMFTGSAPYADILRRLLDPRLCGRLLSDTAVAVLADMARPRADRCDSAHPMAEPALRLAAARTGRAGDLGRLYHSGEIIVRQGDVGDCMYVVQEGTVEVVVSKDRAETTVAVLGQGEFFGEMALFERDVRSATVRAIGEVRALTVDGTTFLRRVHEDPSLALRVVRKLCSRLRDMNQITAGGPRDALPGVN